MPTPGDLEADPDCQNDVDGYFVALQVPSAMEYCDDSCRQRYMVRPRDPVLLSPPQDGSGDYDLDIGAWHDYSGASIYGDYAIEAVWDGQHQTVTGANVTDTLAHEPGMVQYDRAAAAGEEQSFLHGNLVGTTERLTDATGSIAWKSVFTAFGEPVSSKAPGPLPQSAPPVQPSPTRYGYVGAWGYQDNPLSTGQQLGGGGGLCDPADPQAFCDPVALLGWLHIGERYYDPASGRFMQRDPIGIRGGSNVYVYVVNDPTSSVDPLGLDTVSAGLEMQVILPALAFSINIAGNFGYSEKDGWSAGPTITIGDGFGSGIGIASSAGPTITWTNADNVQQLLGCGGTMTFTGGPVGIAGVTDGNNYGGVELSLGKGGGVGGSVQRTRTYGGRQITDPIGNLLWKIVNGGGSGGYRPY